MVHVLNNIKKCKIAAQRHPLQTKKSEYMIYGWSVIVSCVICNEM